MFRKTITALAFGAVFLAAASSNVLAATTYSTTDKWTTNNSIAPFGPDSATATYGQIIETTKFSNVLNSFEFFLNTSGNAINFVAQVYSWDSLNKSTSGNALFSSSVLSVKSSDFEKVHIGTGETTLAKNSEYVLLFTTNGVVANVANAMATFGWVGGNTDYGTGVWNNNRGANANSNPWDGVYSGGSFAFNAVFNSVADSTVSGAVQAVPGPEAGAGLGALAMGGMALYLKRRRKEEAAA